MVINSNLSTNELISQIHAGIGLIDTHDHLTQVNPYMANSLGFAPQEMIGKPIMAFVKPEQLTFLNLKLEQLKLGQNFFIPISLQGNDQQQIECLLSFSGIYPEDGSYQGAAFFMLDIKQDLFFQLLTERQILQKGRTLSGLSRIMAEITRTWDLKRMLTLVFSSIQTATGFDGGSFFGDFSEKPSLYVYPQDTLITMPDEIVIGFRHIITGHPDLLQKKVRILSDTDLPPEHLELFHALFSMIAPEEFQRAKAVMVFELEQSSRIKGIFGFFHPSEKSFTSEMLEMVDIVTAYAAVAIENIHLIRDLEILAAEKERLKLSRELHDSVAQGIYSMMLYGETSRRALSANKLEVVAENLEEMLDLSRQAMSDLRLLIFELRPPSVEQIGLTGAIVSRLESVEKRSGTRTTCNFFGDSNLTPDHENQLYWIVHEALNNVLKHANAKNVSVDIHFTRNMTLVVVKDDGVGFEVANSGKTFGVGLKSMAERVEQLEGQLAVITAPGQGTTIEIKIHNKEP